MPVSLNDVLKVGKADALAAVRDALASAPGDGAALADARSEQFVQWRARTIETLEKAFHDGAGPVERFREIEFGPRRLSGDEERDAAFRRDACRAGSAAARQLFHRIIDRVGALAEPGATVLAPDDALVFPTTPDEVIVASAPDAMSMPAAPAEQPGAAEEPPASRPSTLHLTEEPMPNPTPTAPPATPAAGPSRLAAAARRSLGRALVAWERGDPDAAAVASARLLSDLTLLATDPQFGSAYTDILSRSSAAWADGPDAAAESDPAGPPSPLAVWSLLVTLTRMAA